MSDFKLSPTPLHCGDDTINKMFDGELGLARATMAAIKRLEENMHKPPDIDLTRQYDIEVSVVESAPPSMRWQAVDANTYDGSTEGCGGFIGRGPSAKAARMDLLEQFAAYDDRTLPRASRVVHASPFEPGEYADERYVNPDEE